MKYQDKIKKAKTKLMLEQPYFGTIASAIILEKNNDILTFINDGEKMCYNSEYLDKLSVDEVEFIVANAAMHSVLNHQKRSTHRTRWLWQTATDYVVNAMLVNNGMPLPLYANYESQFENMYAEEVYEILRAEMISNGQSSMGEEQQDIIDSDDVDAPNLHLQKDIIPSNEALNSKIDSNEKEQNNIGAEVSFVDEEMKEQFEQIFQKLKRQGTLPKNIHYVVPEYFSHRIDWREFLYVHIAEYAKSTYSFSPPNMKYLYRGIYLPALSSDLLRIVIAIDTSGSIDKTLLGIFLDEVSSIMQQYPNYEIDLLTADAKVQSHKVFLPAEALEYKVSGGGGTDFRPVFEFIEQHIDSPSLLLYFTDGEGTYPKNEASYDVLWMMPERKDVPFGEVVVFT